MPETLVLLHGFAGTSRAWDPVVAELGERYRPIALDLPVDEGFDACVTAVLEATPERFALCGYSQGGRIAMLVALAAPERITRLVLVSTTAGIDDPAQRAERRRRDDELATFAEGASIEAFADRWQSQPLFTATPADVALGWRDDILRWHPHKVAAALRATGTGAMQPLWDRLAELHMPVDVVAGERDAKFCAIAERLVGCVANARLVVIPGAGHGLPREAPRELAEVLAS